MEDVMNKTIWPIFAAALGHDGLQKLFTPRGIRISKYTPHQGKKEKIRRLRQIAKSNHGTISAAAKEN
jgi:hypothetical protein